MDQVPVTKIVMTSALSEVGAVVGRIMQAVAAQGYDPCACFGIRLALDEALSNAVRHGNCCNARKHVIVEHRISNEEVSVTITDQGRGFTPERVPDCTRDENIERPNGRGVMLMRAYMDQVIFNHRGNQVTLIKHRAGTGPHGPGFATACPSRKTAAVNGRSRGRAPRPAQEA
jgi:serine/threonine-protein kinase RsbW